MNSLQDTSLSFIGCGVMAEAIIGGLLRRELVTSAQIIGSHPRPARREELQTKYGITVVESNAQAANYGPMTEDDRPARKSSIVILAVKPQRVSTVLNELRGQLQEEQLVLSIVAGAKIETLASELGHPSIVRAMPNTTPQVGDAQLAQVRALLGALGKEMYVETERMIDMATALSATGPTYIFLVMEALVDAGVHMGFSRHVAQELVLQTMLGSVLFAKESHKHPAELRNMVTSPGGTSAEAIYQMEKGGMRTVLSKAVWAAFQRAVALGRTEKAG